MQLLIERIQREGKYLGNGILKVDAFMNHQIDVALMQEIGREFAQRFRETRPTKILTAEASGIAPAFATAAVLGVPLVFARKHKPVTMAGTPFRQVAPSHTHGREVELLVSPEFLGPADRVLIIDDFLASAQTIVALAKLVEQSGATLVGVGAVIEKSFEGGRAMLRALQVPTESLARIARFEGMEIVFEP